jgi:hypothetical protein
VTVNWQQSTSTDFCSQYGDVARVSIPWGGFASPHQPGVVPSDYGNALRSNEVLVISVPVPASIQNMGGFQAIASQYAGNPEYKTVTLSRSPCDFRPLDRTGQNGPISSGTSATVTVYGSASMTTGQTWYVNVKNANGCSSRCDAIVNFQWPN